MGIFSKTEKIEVMLDFKSIPPTKGDQEAYMIDIEAYSYINNSGIRKYLYASVVVNSFVYEEFLDAISKYTGKIKYILKVKNGVLKNFDIDFDDLAIALKNEKFRYSSIAGYGINEYSYFG